MSYGVSKIKKRSLIYISCFLRTGTDNTFENTTEHCRTFHWLLPKGSYRSCKIRPKIFKPFWCMEIGDRIRKRGRNQRFQIWNVYKVLRQTHTAQKKYTKFPSPVLLKKLQKFNQCVYHQHEKKSEILTFFVTFSWPDDNFFRTDELQSAKKKRRKHVYALSKIV